MSNDAATKPQQQQRRGGGSSCTVCAHARRDEFDRALASGTMSQSAVAREISCHRSVVHRHAKNHILPEVQQQMATDPVMSSIDVFAEIRELYGRMKRHLERAESTDNWHAIRALHAEARADLETFAKLTGKLHDGPTVSVVIAPQWIELRTVIMRALGPYPEAAQAVASAISSGESGTSNEAG